MSETIKFAKEEQAGIPENKCQAVTQRRGHTIDCHNVGG